MKSGAVGRLEQEREYERLVAVHYRFVYRFLYWLQPDRSVAEDLTQTTFLRAWQALPTRRTGTDGDRAWLAAIARRAALDHMRRPQARLVPLSEAHSVSDPTPEAADQVAAADEQARLTQALLQLPEAYRTAVVLTRVEELSTAEAAHILGVPQGTVKWRVYRGLRLLRARLEEGSDAKNLEVIHA